MAEFADEQLLVHFRPSPLLLFPCFRESATHCGGQPRQSLLQDIISCAAPEGIDRRVFAENTGNENEGRVWSRLHDDIKRSHAVKVRQGKICENDIELLIFQRLDEGSFTHRPGYDRGRRDP